MKNYIIYLILAVALFTSCDKKEDFEQVNSSVMDISGEWWMEYSAGDYHSGLTKLIISNTAADDGTEIWISDEHNFWEYKVKCPVDIDNLTFSGNELENLEYDILINIKEGKMLEGVAKSTSGLVTDSLYFEIEFGDEPGTVYQASGWRKTGFLEDEH